MPFNPAPDLQHVDQFILSRDENASVLFGTFCTLDFATASRISHARRHVRQHIPNREILLDDSPHQQDNDGELIAKTNRGTLISPIALWSKCHKSLLVMS